MARIMALDVGDKRIGVAVTDPTGLLASPHSVIVRSESDPGGYQAIRELVADLQPERLVVGLPRSLSGQEGRQAEKVRSWAEPLVHQLGCALEFMDERLTSRQAERSLLAAGLKRRQRKEVIDKVAAAMILKTYLQQQSRED